jgi:hypothetical protein
MVVVRSHEVPYRFKLESCSDKPKGLPEKLIVGTGVLIPSKEYSKIGTNSRVRAYIHQTEMQGFGILSCMV